MQAPIYAPWASEDVLSGGRALHQAFVEAPRFSATRGAAIVAANDPEPAIFLIQHGFAFRSTTLPGGRRAIVDIFLPMDFAGVDHLVIGRSEQEIVAASSLSYRVLRPATVRELMKDQFVTLRFLALLAEQRRRLEQHLTVLARFDARERVCAFVTGIYDRLLRGGLVSRPTFNLPLNQDQMADHLGMTMVHISRTLRRLREERLLLVDRQVVTISDVGGVRELAKGARPAMPPPLEAGGAGYGAYAPGGNTLADSLRR